jgi:hypothetical protein
MPEGFSAVRSKGKIVAQVARSSGIGVVTRPYDEHLPGTVWVAVGSVAVILQII